MAAGTTARVASPHERGIFLRCKRNYKALQSIPRRDARSISPQLPRFSRRQAIQQAPGNQKERTQYECNRATTTAASRELRDREPQRDCAPAPLANAFEDAYLKPITCGALKRTSVEFFSIRIILTVFLLSPWDFRLRVAIPRHTPLRRLSLERAGDTAEAESYPTPPLARLGLATKHPTSPRRAHPLPSIDP